MLHEILTLLASLIHEATPILQQYGLAAVFVALAVENLGVIFAPGESVIVTASFLAAKSVFPIWEVLVLGILACVLGQYAAYGLGARYGHVGLLRYGRYVGIKPVMIDRVHTFFSRFGVPVVLVGRFIIPLRQLQGYLAGSAEMPWISYAIWNAMGAVLWVSAWGIGTFLLAKNIPV